MKTKIFSVILIFILTVTAQNNFQKGYEYCAHKKQNSTNIFLPGDMGPNSPRHSYDVLDYKLNLDIRSCFISPYPKSFTASVIITFRADSTLNFINLYAVNTSLLVTGVSLSGVSFTHTNNTLTVNLDRTYNPNEVTQVKVDYQHQNVSDGAFYVNSGFVFTDCEPEGARKWFPCWDRPYDKATVELTAKVPANAKLGSNGKLVDSLLTGDTLYYHWKSRDPISTYLIVMSAKVNYNLDLVYWVPPDSSPDSIPIRFYYNSGENPSGIKNIIRNMTTYYSVKFGVHPFEKNGFATLNSDFSWGGMENQTLTSLCPGCWSEWLVSHEFAHQWFGDMITCGTWGDIWLNEGFATYCEALWLENTGGYSSYKTSILGDASTYFSGNTGNPIYRPDWINNTPPVGQLFNTAMTYCKPSAVLHMLRYTMGDSAFFRAIRSYATDTANFKYKSAVTDDFTASINQSYGSDLAWFVDEWYKQPNHPVYANLYQFVNVGGGNWAVGFQATQTQTNTPFHRMPVVLRITFSSGPDTSIRVDNTFNNQVWWWTFNRQPTAFAFDPNNDIVLKQGATTSGIVGVIANNNEVPDRFGLKQNYPNPFNPVTKIDFDLPARSNVALNVYDAAGRLVSNILTGDMEAGKYSANFNALNFASGVYYYELSAVSDTKGIFRDVKKMVVLK